MKIAFKPGVKVTILENTDPLSAETAAIQARIVKRAYEISHNRPHDAHQQYDWSKAESEIISIPRGELLERSGKFELKLALAGVDPGDVTVLVAANHVVVKAQSSHQHQVDEAAVHFCDFRSASIFRSIPLPNPIDTKSVKVSFTGGILSIVATKAGEEKNAPKRAASTRKASAAKASPGKA